MVWEQGFKKPCHFKYDICRALLNRLQKQLLLPD